MEMIRIVNWEKFQHYGDREPPWIKLHSKLLQKYKFRCLQDDSKLLLILLWLVRSRISDIEADPKYLREITGMKHPVRLQPLIDAGFIECYQDDSKVVASCYLEESREEERRERRAPAHAREESKPLIQFLDFVKMTQDEHDKLVKKLTGPVTEDYIERLNNYLGNLKEKAREKYHSHYYTILTWHRKDYGSRGKNNPAQRTAPKRDFDGQQSAYGETVRI